MDGTVGAGGHARGILESSSPTGQLLGLDLDPQALDLAKKKLRPYKNRAILTQASYLTLKDQLRKLQWEKVDGIVLDLGLSSIQMDTPERGFSFRFDGPLDMRFGPENDVRAADLVNTLSENDLADLIYRFGEERRSRSIARVIVNSRPIESTHQLAEIISAVFPKGQSRIHPATRTFQALRIATNNELDAVQKVLPIAVSALAPQGRLAVISFHSLEDRLVKQYFRRESRDCVCPPGQPVCTCEHRASVAMITRKPISPSMDEIAQNHRARSARLRVVEKL